MLFLSVNWLAVVLATIASMAFGAAWYMGLSKQWMAAVGKTPEQVRSGNSATPFIIGAICELVMAFGLALLIPMLMPQGDWVAGLMVGVAMWFGFVITSMMLNHRYEGARWSLTVIDGGHLLGVLAIQGVVIGLFA